MIEEISEVDVMESPFITHMTSMKELEDFTGAHKRCLVMMSMKGCVACNLAIPHIIAAAEKYQKKLWIGYLDIDQASIKVSAVPIFQCFFNGYKVGELVDRGYSLDALNDLMERLWLTKMRSEKTGEENINANDPQ